MMNCRYPQPDSSLRLFCFPWAGGGSNFYARWGKDVPVNIEVFGVTLRGRESRFAETPCVSATETVAEIASTIHSEYGEKPVILFGHSMGALLCFQTAVFLKTVYGKEPQHLYLSGISAPHTESRRRESKDLSTTSDEEFEQYVKELGGTPPEILENQDLFKLFLPTLKADFTIVNQIVSEPPDGHPPLSCPITFFDGAEDNVHDYEGWSQLTSGSFTLYKFPGGHFYIKDEWNYKRIIEIIRKDFPSSFGC
ncbi:S-acyl fatty acid synthase thioesterase, medium chain-like [Pomacea canaliculata]|uniref:S-acyl fatty acid synthase thioesterase, medium chain-like n=1 Tax=Pomacea canaliculata TaxID=400727 RepID=UPI000D72DB92|nr:S-acyl fatty acid synthase thioesterase, medium chain-like [Pomacea canaliculata]